MCTTFVVNKRKRIYVCLLSGCLTYLLSTPDHAMVVGGSDVNFTCRSSIPHGISWYFRNLVDGRLLPVNDTSASISYSPDHKTSILQLRGVEKQMTGTYKCVDANEAAFADLTVLGKFSIGRRRSQNFHCGAAHRGIVRARSGKRRPGMDRCHILLFFTAYYCDDLFSHRRLRCIMLNVQIAP